MGGGLFVGVESWVNVLVGVLFRFVLKLVICGRLMFMWVVWGGLCRWIDWGFFLCFFLMYS